MMWLWSDRKETWNLRCGNSGKDTGNNVFNQHVGTGWFDSI